MPDFTTIITSAAVATVISGGVTLLASWRQRSHDAKMEKLADARTLRDRKIERVWKGLNVVCEVAVGCKYSYSGQFGHKVADLLTPAPLKRGYGKS
jgi:hypothetical protein